ncbi:MAG: STAS domain-containing protein [Phycisphaerae bacterium]|jgi:anti-anti-sigma factor
MKFDLHEASPGFVVLTCNGGLSWEDRELLSASVEQYLVGRESIRGLALDMSQVEFVNSAGLGALFQLVQRLRSRGGRLAYAAVPATIRRLLSTVGMERLALFAENIPEALQLLAEQEQPAAEGNPGQDANT